VYNWISGSLSAKHDDDCIYRLPYLSGETYRVTQGFNGSFSHKGNSRFSIDWSMPEGTLVCAARGGIVVGVKSWSCEGGGSDKYKDKGNYIMIRHTDGTIGEYDHLVKDGAKVKVGQVVQLGDVIGLSGKTGFASGPHLHFCVYKAIDGKTRETFPIRFKTSDLLQSMGEILIQGKQYTAP
jgi:murein DD-endopeptidase MepM/ murein hydrolase activator NlpD